VFRSITDGDHQAPPRADEGVPFLVISDIRSGVIDYNGSRFVPALYYESLDTARRPAIGDLLYTLVGSFGIPVVVREATPFCVQRHIGILRPSWLIPVDFLALLMDSMLVYKQASDIATGIAQKTVPLGGLRSVRVPLPPLAEQHRIVAKVDELMAFCDQLEAARQQREQCRERLVAASLQRLNQLSQDSKAFRSDARFALQVLPSLTTTPAQIKQLRQTILNLAMRGKLVEQDPEDEPAEELLRCIAADRSLLQRTRGRLRNEEIKPIPSDLVPYELPQSWKWARFGDIMYSRDGERVPVSKDERSRRAKTYDYYGASGVIDKIDGFLFDKPLLLIGEDGANLLNRSTPIAFIARGKYWVNNHAHVLDGISEEFLRFIELTINATDLAPYVTGTAQPKMNQAKMNSIPVALPPLAEQHRIVAKVDELMALCDQLEKQLSQADQVRRGLLLAVLQEALTEPDRALIAAARAFAA
jgi:type I restriction enzyme S subunit